jgi:uncharacterized protein (TIGR03435 family)
MAELVRLLSEQLGGTVVDRTGLTGSYDFTLQWKPDPGRNPMFKGAEGDQQPEDTSPSDASVPSIFTAIHEQLGLKLESQKGPVQTLVIDHVEKPSEN